MTYAGEGKVVLTTTVILRIQGKTLRLPTIEENLNNGSAFSFTIPTKWRAFTRSSTSNHDGQMSILLGGDNLLSFPTEIEQDPLGMALYRSTLTNNCSLWSSSFQLHHLVRGSPCQHRQHHQRFVYTGCTRSTPPLHLCRRFHNTFQSRTAPQDHQGEEHPGHHGQHCCGPRQEQGPG